MAASPSECNCTNLQHNSRINALEIAMAWLLTRNEHDAFFPNGVDVISRDREGNRGGWNREDIEYHREDFERIQFWMQEFTHIKSDPTVPPLDVE